MRKITPVFTAGGQDKKSVSVMQYTACMQYDVGLHVKTASHIYNRRQPEWVCTVAVHGTGVCPDYRIGST